MKKVLKNSNLTNINKYKEFLNDSKPLCEQIKSKEKNELRDKAKSSLKMALKSHNIAEKKSIKNKNKEKLSNSLHKIKKREEENNKIKNKKPKGLYNLGLNCYMNSLLQCLYNIKELREYFIENKNSFTEKQLICKAFAEVMDKLKNDENETIKPKALKELLGKSNNLFDHYKAADVKDLFFTLIDSFLTEFNTDNDEDNNKEKNSLLEPDFSNTKIKMFEEVKNEVEQNNNIINKLFFGYYYTVYYCDISETETYSFQTESFIKFDLQKIKQFFHNQKEISLILCFVYNIQTQRNSSFYCNNCKETHIGSSNLFLYRPPKILVIILDRGHGKTFDGEIEIDKELDLKTFIYEENYEYSTSYKLICISTHRGDSSPSGHYTACCLNDNGKYYYFSDSYVNEIKEKDFIRDDPYLLFYIQSDYYKDKNNDNDSYKKDN